MVTWNAADEDCCASTCGRIVLMRILGDNNPWAVHVDRKQIEVTETLERAKWLGEQALIWQDFESALEQIAA